jgi:hypothetical protein
MPKGVERGVGHHWIICGGRDYRLTDDDFARLDLLHALYGARSVLVGAQTGADAWGEAWAHGARIPVRQFPADFDRLGPAAGPRRNLEMARKATHCVAFPGGPGTDDLVRQARRHGLVVFDFRR